MKGSSWGEYTPADGERETSPRLNRAVNMSTPSCTKLEPIFRWRRLIVAYLLGSIPLPLSFGDDPVVACCQSDGGCVIAAHSACVQQSGDPQPPGVSCSGVTCGSITWAQAPQFDPGGMNPNCLDGWSSYSRVGGAAILADRFVLPVQTTISEIHWWGGHSGWSSSTPPVDGLAWFHVGVWSDVPAGTGVPVTPWDRPGTLLWVKSSQRIDLAETAVGCAPNFDEATETSEVFRYDLSVPEAERFQSGSGGAYWLSVAAAAIDVACACNGDVVTPNGSPSSADAAFISAHVGCAVATGDAACDPCDVNCNGVVDSVDVAVVAQCQVFAGWADPSCCVPPTEYPWGWMTRPNGSSDGAVAITSPTTPQVGGALLSAERVTGAQGAPWNLSFVLNGATGSRFVPDAPLPESSGVNKNRYVSFGPASTWAGREIAVRIRLVNLDRFAAFNGQSRWIAAPSVYADNPAGSFRAAPLECIPTFMDWATVPVVHGFGAAVVPQSVYEIQAVDRSCETTLGDESCYSPPLTVVTGEWGDVVAPFGGATQPNFGDVTALVDKFKSLPTSLPRVRAQLRPNVVVPANNVSFQDVSLLVGAFQGTPYSFAGPSACP